MSSSCYPVPILSCQFQRLKPIGNTTEPQKSPVARAHKTWGCPQDRTTTSKGSEDTRFAEEAKGLCFNFGQPFFLGKPKIPFVRHSASFFFWRVAGSSEHCCYVCRQIMRSNNNTNQIQASDKTPALSRNGATRQRGGRISSDIEKNWILRGQLALPRIFSLRSLQPHRLGWKISVYLTVLCSSPGSSSGIPSATPLLAPSAAQGGTFWQFSCPWFSPQVRSSCQHRCRLSRFRGFWWSCSLPFSPSPVLRLGHFFTIYERKQVSILRRCLSRYLF